MGFKLITSYQNNTETIVLKSATAQVTVLSKVGALLQSYEVFTENSSFNCIDGLKNVANAAVEVKEWFRGAKLSPFPARIQNGVYTFNDQQYEFQQKFNDGSAIHGILFDKPFEVINQSILDDKASVVLLYSYRGEDKGFPFHYDCYIDYTLDKNDKLTITTKIVNQDTNEIPMADGWHPYFTLGGDVDDWRLKINTNRKLVLTEELVPNGETTDAGMEEPLELNGASLDDSFIIKKTSPTARLFNPNNGWGIEFCLLENYPILQVFIPDHRKSIAIEPFSSAPNSFNNNIGLFKLKVADQISFSWSIHLINTKLK